MENKGTPVSGYGPPVPGQEHQMGVMSPQGTGQPMMAPPGYVQQPPAQPYPQQQQMHQQQMPHQHVPQQVFGAQHNGMYGVPIVSLAAQAAPVQCPHCNYQGMTAVGYESGGFTHLMALLACCIICLGCIPYMIASLKDVHHKCTQCGTPLATYHRSGRTDVHYHPPAPAAQSPPPVTQ